jgi:hypothetical protein
MDDWTFGESFTVKADAEVTEALDDSGVCYARYLPGYSYRVTPRNAEVVRAMDAEGKLIRGRVTAPTKSATRVGASKAQVSGTVQVVG